MPIKRLTKEPTFPKIGTLRKGAPKGTNSPGRDLQYFRFDSSDPKAQADFEAAYGKAPASINCYLPHQTPDENFEAWQEEWVAGGLVHRCDGEVCTVHKTPDGKYSTAPVPCPYHIGKEKRTKANPGCTPVGRLTLIVPELLRFAYVTSLTYSINDILELMANIGAIYAMRGSLQGVPMVLSRRPEKISTPGADGKRARREMWMLHIEADPAWVELQLAGMRQHALAGPSNIRMLTSGRTVTSDGEILNWDTPDLLDGDASFDANYDDGTDPDDMTEFLLAGNKLDNAKVEPTPMRTVNISEGEQLADPAKPKPVPAGMHIPPKIEKPQPNPASPLNQVDNDVDFGMKPSKAKADDNSFDGWGDWTTMSDYPDAQQWGRDSDKFGAERHFMSSWTKVFKEHAANKPENALAFLSAWRKYVNDHK